MGNVLIDNNGNALLSGNKALEVTASIDSNIVAGNIKKDVTILGVTGIYEGSGGGGNDIVITNPLNGSVLGTPTSYGTVTHQYQVSEGTIVDGFLITNSYNHLAHYDINPPHYDNYSFPIKMVGGDYGWDNYPPYSSSSFDASLNSSGLLTVNYRRNDVSEYEWSRSNSHIIMVGLILNNGYTLYDTFGYYFEYSCFIKDTQIKLFDNTSKLIQNITYNDELLVWNFDEGKYDVAKPIWIKKEEKTNWYYKLTFSDGNILCVTGTYPEAHSLFSVDDNKFIHANKLVGKKVYTLNGIQTLVTCEEIYENIEFYNIITNYHMNLFANNILSSTNLNNIYPISNMKFIKEKRIPIYNYSFLDKNMIEGLRLNEQSKNVSDYCKNLIKNKLWENTLI